MTYTDINDNVLKDGDVIDINQTVNGQSTFVVISIEPLDIRYEYSLQYKYEYDKEDLLNTEFEIINNINQ